MKVHVVHAHPVETSYNRALFSTVVEALQRNGHEVDALNLYDEEFQAAMSREERLNYHDVPGNLTALTKPYVDRIMATEAMVPDAQAAAERLLKNQEDIGKAVGRFYGPAADKQLTTLLKEHISIAVDLIKAAKGGDKAGQQQADSRWQQNGLQIAEFLSKANPNWPRATLVAMMNTHLRTTTDEVVARLTKNWDADVRAFDAVYNHILMMADALSDGIVAQFPAKFGK